MSSSTPTVMEIRRNAGINRHRRHQSVGMNNRAAAALLGLCTMIACGFSGDGEYSTYGVDPLKGFSLALPPVTFGTGVDRVFSFAGYGGESARVELLIVGELSLQFAELSTEMTVTITDDEKNRVFKKSGALNAHYARTVDQREFSWPLADEWMAECYLESPRDGASRLSRDPQPTDSCTYWSLERVPMDDDNHVVTITFGDVAPQHEHLTVQVMLVSGAK